MSLIYWCLHDVITQGAGGDSIGFYSCAQMSLARGDPLPGREGPEARLPTAGPPGSVDAVPPGTHAVLHVNADAGGLGNIHGLTRGSATAGLCLEGCSAAAEPVSGGRELFYFPPLE